MQIDRPSNVERLNHCAFWLFNEKSVHFNVILDEAEPYLMKIVHRLDQAHFIELQVEINDLKFDLWLRLVKTADNYRLVGQRGRAVEMVQEVAIAKGLLDTPTLGGAISAFLGNYDGTDMVFLFESEREKAKAKAEEEMILQYGIEADIERDAENPEEMYVEVKPDADPSMLIIHSPISLSSVPLVGIEMRTESVHVGHWSEDDEWVIDIAIGLDGSVIKIS